MPKTGKLNRRSIRLAGHDYSYVGVYFVTVCTAKRRPLFGEVVNGRMVLSEAGKVAAVCWQEIPVHFPHAHLDAWVVMPNHIHGIIVIGFDGHGGGAIDSWDDTDGGAVGVTRNTVGDAHVAHVMPVAHVGAENFPPLHGQQQRQQQRQRQHHGHQNDPPTAPSMQNQWIVRPNGTTRTIGSMVRGFKIGVTNWYRDRGIGDTIWHRNYWEHIVRDENGLRRIRAYIADNPTDWVPDDLSGLEPKA